MRALTRAIVAVTTIALVFAFVQCGYAQMSIDGELNIVELMEIAKNEFDLSNEDAVLLYDGKTVTWQADGRLVNHIHKIIWIGTDIGSGQFGDHRVPYDSVNCTFDVETIRTWRDGQWWVTGPTGIVETLPYAVFHAYDYSNLREMMLLHDGIELPCILEISYTIEDKEPFRKGADGLWLFMRDYPIVRSSFSVSFPAEEPCKTHATEDVPEVTVSDDAGAVSHFWTMGPLDAQPQPRTDDPASYIPHVSWSTWDSWSDYGSDLLGVFESAMDVDDLLRHSLDSLVEKARTDAEKAELIAEFVEQTVSSIHYPERYWLWSPRLATRTYSTAYGHGLDRAVLAASLFREAGLTAIPMFISRGYGDVDEGVPTLARMGDVGVAVSGEGFPGCYDPERGDVISITTGGIFARTEWSLEAGNKPSVAMEVIEEVFSDLFDESSDFDMRIDLKYDSEGEKFSGTGCLAADGLANPLAKMRGLSDETKSYLGSVVSSIVDGADVTSYNPSQFDDLRVVVGFEFELKKPDLDSYDRIPLVIGTPSDGIAGMLPDDVQLFHQKRTSPIHLPSEMSQKIEIRLNMKGLETVYQPSDQTIENGAGNFAVTVKADQDRFTIVRELVLTNTAYGAEEWTDLRALLLADQHERNQTLILKTTEDDEEDGELAVDK
jgi:hypothetical protein